MADIRHAKITREEQETHIYLDALSNTAVVDTSIPKDYNKALRRGWKPKVRYLDSTGSVIGYTFEVPRSLITFRSPSKMTPEEAKRRTEKMRQARESKNS